MNDQMVIDEVKLEENMCMLTLQLFTTGMEEEMELLTNLKRRT